MHGPGSVTATNPYGWEPTFKPPIRVVDGVVETLGRLHRPAWRKMRDRALALWCLPFALEEGTGTISEVGASSAFIPGAIHLVRLAGDGRAHGGWNSGAQGSIAHIGMWSHWWKLLWYNAFIAVVCHELGHCLGLAHRYTPPDNHGVMSGDLKPDVHDLDSVRGFYT